MSYLSKHRATWSDEENQKLREAIDTPGVKTWRQVAEYLPGRTIHACQNHALYCGWRLHPARKRVWPLQRRVKLARRIQEGATALELAKEFKEPRKKIRDAARRLRLEGLLAKNKGVGKYHIWTPEETQQIVADWKRGLSSEEIGAKLGFDAAQVWGRLYRVGAIGPRSRGPSPALQRKMDLVWERRGLGLDIETNPLRLWRVDAHGVKLKQLSGNGTTWAIMEWVVDGILLGAKLSQPRKESDHGEFRHQQTVKASESGGGNECSSGEGEQSHSEALSGSRG